MYHPDVTLEDTQFNVTIRFKGPEPEATELRRDIQRVKGVLNAYISWDAEGVFTLTVVLIDSVPTRDIRSQVRKLAIQFVKALASLSAKA